MTLMLFCNMDGSEKVKPICIGKVKTPGSGCLKDFNMTVADLPVDYYNSNKGWMTGWVFDQNLSRWNNKLVFQNRKILLFLDNAPSHIMKEDYTYTNINVQFLPPNTTSTIQPLDQGISSLLSTCTYRQPTQVHEDMIC